MQQTKPRTFGTLFSGVGGLDLGLERAGWSGRWMAEWDRWCQQVLAHRYPGIPVHGDVRDVNGADLEPVDLVAFGSPCQSLSLAGQRAGFSEGSTSSMFFEAERIISEMRAATNNQFPRWVMWENVGGALSCTDGRDFAAVLDSLAGLGASTIEWGCLDARFFGVPQRRFRVFVIAYLGDGEDRLPTPLLPLAGEKIEHVNAGTQLMLVTDDSSSPSKTLWPGSGPKSRLSWPNQGRWSRGGDAWTRHSLPQPAEGPLPRPTLADLLEPLALVDRRYFLSPTAALGILARSDKRDRTLPPLLDRALRAVAGQPTDDDPANPGSGPDGEVHALTASMQFGPDVRSAQGGHLLALPATEGAVNALTCAHDGDDAPLVIDSAIRVPCALAENQRGEVRVSNTATALGLPSGKMGQGTGYVLQGDGEAGGTHVFQEAQYGVAEFPEAGTLRAGRMPEHQFVMQTPDPLVIQDTRPLLKAQNGIGVSAAGEAYTLDTTGSQGVAQPIEPAGAGDPDAMGSAATDPITFPVEFSNQGCGDGQESGALCTHPMGVAQIADVMQPITFPAEMSTYNPRYDGLSETLTVKQRMAVALVDDAQNPPANVAVDFRSGTVDAEVAHCLQSGGHGTSPNDVPHIVTSGEDVAYPVARRGRDDGAQMEVGDANISNTLRAGDGGSSRASEVITPELAVRRLTPLECERLQSWPDGWTAVGINGPISDSQRYKMAGNGVASVCSEWLGHRIAHADALVAPIVKAAPVKRQKALRVPA